MKLTIEVNVNRTGIWPAQAILALVDMLQQDWGDDEDDEDDEGEDHSGRDLDDYSVYVEALLHAVSAGRRCIKTTAGLLVVAPETLDALAAAARDLAVLAVKEAQAQRDVQADIGRDDPPIGLPPPDEDPEE